MMKSAFCCASRRTGTLIIGWINLVLALVLLVTGSYVLDMAGEQAVPGKHDSLDSYKDRDISQHPPAKQAQLVSRDFYGLVLLYIFIDVCLLYGADKGRRIFLLPYMIITAVFVCFFVYCLGSDIVHILQGTSIQYRYPRMRLILLPISFYIMSIVTCYYAELNEKALSEDKSTASATSPPPKSPNPNGAQPMNHYVQIQKQDPSETLPLSEKEFTKMP